MTIRKSAAQPISFSVAGDLVRITEAAGAQIAAIGPLSSSFVHGAFGRVVALADGKVGMKMHELMPGEIRALETIEATQGTQVERIFVDNESEVAVLGLQYLRGLAEQIRSRVAGQQNLRPLMVAALKTDSDRLSEVLARSDLKAVEFSETKTIITKKIYLTADPASIREGVIPDDAIGFDLEPITTDTKSVETFGPDRVMEVLFSKSSVATNAVPAQAQEGAAPLSPFMRGLIGQREEAGDLNLGDVLGGDDEDGQHDHPHA